MGNETTTTVTGLAPGLIRALRRAATIAADHGHNWIGEEDLLAAILGGEDSDDNPIGRSTLEARWRIDGAGPMTYEELRQFVHSIVPGPGRGAAGPSGPATVAYTLEGPNADEMRSVVDR